ncbi:hypothetical protein [Actinorhabdospora filicis]|nr:hypothetical protein [Actinorhabdospora filicis]
MLKKILTWGGLAFLVFFVAYRPKEASNVVGNIGGGIMDAVRGLGDFVSNLLS